MYKCDVVARSFAWLPRHVFLRTGDAVHLVTARQNGLQEVFSNDERLLVSCIRNAFAVDLE